MRAMWIALRKRLRWTALFGSAAIALVGAPATADGQAPPAGAAPFINTLVDAQPTQTAGTVSIRGSTCTNCWFPPAGSDSYSEDLYERPFDSGNTGYEKYFQYIDIVSSRMGIDADWVYYRLDTAGSLPGTALESIYGFEFNFIGGTRAERGDVFVRISGAKDLANNGAWTQPGGLVAFRDSNGDIGGSDPKTSGGGHGNGYEASLTIGNNIWVRRRDNFSLEFAVRRSWLQTLSNNLPGASQPLRPAASFRGWAGDNNLGAPESFHFHDSRSRSEIGSPYPWLTLSGAPGSCPNLRGDNAILESGTFTNTGFTNPCWPTSGNLSKVDNTGSARSLAEDQMLGLTTVDLAIAKTAAPEPVLVGDTLTYTLTVTNPAAGSSLATGVVVTDTLPAGVAFLSAASSQGSCSQASGVVTCTVGTMATNSTATVLITVTAPAAAQSITNVARVSSVHLDTNTANNRATATTTVTSGVDLSITKTDSPDPVLVNGTLTYTLTVTNPATGSGPATGGVVTDTLPAGVTFQSANSTQGACVEASGVVTCTVGAMAIGSTATITIVVTAPATPGSITNTARVAAAETDTDPSDNVATATTTVIVGVDLVVAKAPTGVFRQDAPASYRIVVTNVGTGTTPTSFTVTDTLVAGLTYLPSSATGWTIVATGQVVTATYDNAPPLAAGDSVGFTLNVQVTAVGGSSLTNTAYVSGGGDPDGGSGSVTLTVFGRPALQLVKSASTLTVLPGEDLKYTVTFENTGNEDAVQVVVIDDLPPEVWFKLAPVDVVLPMGIGATVEYWDGSTWSITQPLNPCGAPTGYTACVTRIRISLLNPLPPGSDGIVEFRVGVP